MADNKHINNESKKLTSYYKNELTNAEKHELEKQMLEDGFLADAAEGLNMVENPAMLSSYITAIQASYTGVPTPAINTVPKRPFLSVVSNTLAVAATVTLLVTAAYFISQYVNNGTRNNISIAENKEQHTQPSLNPVTDGSAITPIAGDSLSTDEVKRDTILTAPLTNALTQQEARKSPGKNKRTMYDFEPSYSGNASPIAAEVDMDTPKEEKILEQPTVVSGNKTNNINLDAYGPASNTYFDNRATTSYTAPQINKKKAQNDKSGKKATAKSEDEQNLDNKGVYMNGVMIKPEIEPTQDKSKADDNSFNTTPTKNGSTSKSPAYTTKEKDKAPDGEQLKKGMEYYNNGKYRNAIDEFENLLKQNAGNTKAQFYQAMSYKYSGKESKALEAFKTISPKSPYYENALWEKAQLYRSQKNKAQAILALQEVIKLNGVFKPKAESVLKELKAQ